MRNQRWVTAAAAAAIGLGAPAMAQQLELTGTVRDFSSSHSDFENHANWKFPLVTEMVKPDLGSDDKPVLNPGDGGCIAVEISSERYDLSNVVLKLDDMTEFKYDDLDQGKTGRFEVPVAHYGKKILGIWIKAGSNASGDGPGYGEFVESEFIQFQDTHSVDSESGDFEVKFVCEFGLPEVWRIASEDSFNQWFNNVDDVNLSTKHTIVLHPRPDNPHIYRFEASKHNGQSFFPIDGKLKGNEDNEHNYHFTYEVHTKFTYTDPAQRDYDLTFSFSGDDDVWVFVNRKLVIDLGGVHPEQYGSVNLDEIAAQIGMEPGGTYDLHFFFAERHLVESNFTMETTIQFLSPLYD